MKDENCPTLLNAVPAIVGAMERHPSHEEIVTVAMATMRNMLTVSELQVRVYSGWYMSLMAGAWPSSFSPLWGR